MEKKPPNQARGKVGETTDRPKVEMKPRSARLIKSIPTLQIPLHGSTEKSVSMDKKGYMLWLREAQPQHILTSFFRALLFSGEPSTLRLL
ncbi:MAG: hypothetical protein U9Q78_02500 [Chloroflexota bacterium]|nr:hypothetical protein [Chloroflexota bacterium]